MPAVARSPTRAQPAKAESEGGLFAQQAVAPTKQEPIAVHYVYLLQSLSHSDQRYVGLTGDLKTRLDKHNGGEVSHTSKFKPWHLRTYIAFSTREQAAKFEIYLKSGSGRAFANRHLWPELPA